MLLERDTRGNLRIPVDRLRRAPDGLGQVLNNELHVPIDLRQFHGDETMRAANVNE